MHIYLKLTILPKFIPIQFEMTELRLFLQRLPHQQEQQQEEQDE